MACGMASADSIIQTFTLPLTNTDITGATGSGTFNNFLTECPSCSASWLTGVQLEIAVTEDLNSLSVTNNSSSSNTFTYETYSNLGVVGSAPTADQNLLGFALFNNKSNFVATGGCTAGVAAGYVNLCNTGSVVYSGNQTINYAPPTISASDDSGLQSAGSVTPYDTTGTFNLGFTTTTFQSFIGGGGLDANTQATQATGTVTVIYDYTIPSGTPEPATMALMGGALIGLGLIGKRLKKN